jgi:hypothetical protein
VAATRNRRGSLHRLGVRTVRAFLQSAGFDEEDCRQILHEYLAPPVHTPGGNDENIGGPESFPGMPERGGGQLAGDAAADDFAALYPKAWSPTMGGRRSEYDRMKEEIDLTVAAKRRAPVSQLAQDTSIAESGFLNLMATNRPRCIESVDKAQRLARAKAAQQVRTMLGQLTQLAHDGATGPYDADKMRESVQLQATEQEFEDFIKNDGKPVKWI